MSRESFAVVLADEHQQGTPWRLQAEEAEQNQDWGKAEKLYAEATFIDTAASLINTALWLGLCRTRWHLQLSENSIQACDTTLSLQPGLTEAIKYKVAPARPLPCFHQVDSLANSPESDTFAMSIGTMPPCQKHSSCVCCCLLTRDPTALKPAWCLSTAYSTSQVGAMCRQGRCCKAGSLIWLCKLRSRLLNSRGHKNCSR